jgi:hypothetical protein
MIICYNTIHMSITLAQAVEIAYDRSGQRLAEVSLRAACKRGALRAFKKGKNWHTTVPDLFTYLDGRPDHFQPDARFDDSDEIARDITWYHL